MAKPTTVPALWASTATYPAEVYPATYPPGHPLAGEPHPLAGAPTPWSEQPTVDGAAEIVAALYGLWPGRPVSATAINSRYQTVDGWLAWALAGATGLEGVVVPGGARIVETTSSGDVGLRSIRTRRLDGLNASFEIDGVLEVLTSSALVQTEGRREYSSHEPEFEWGNSYRINERTFTVEGLVPVAPYIVTWPITSTVLSDNNRLYADLPPGCQIAFEYVVEVYVGDGFDPSDRATYHSSRRTSIWTRFASSYSIESTTTATSVVDLGAAVQPLTIAGAGSTRVDLRVLFDALHAGLAYRATAHVVARVIRIADS